MKYYATCGAVAAAAIALLVAGVWWICRPASPDAFYSSNTSTSDPGTLIGAEAFFRAVPENARALRILYASSHSNGTPALASALIVYKPDTGPDSRGIVAWAHGTTGIERGCAPSLMRNPFANVPVFPALLDEGWIFVAADYIGLGTAGPHAYLKGEEAARAVFDAVRAAHQIPELRIPGPTVIWGHSQGGNTALWAGIIHPAYAPEIDLRGVAALAPASDLQGLFDASAGSMFGKIVSAYVLSAAASESAVTWPQHRSGLTEWLAADIASRCVGDWGTLLSAGESLLLPADGILPKPGIGADMRNYLSRNTPTQAVTTKLLVAQGLADDLVLPSVQQAYVSARRAAGQELDYRTYEGLDHISLVAPNSTLGDDLMRWTRERFAEP